MLKNIISKVGVLTAAPSVDPKTTTVQEHLNTFTYNVQLVLTGVIAIVGVLCGVMIVIKKLPKLSEPHAKTEMWEGIGQVLIGVGFATALTWAVPWIEALLK